MGVTRAQVKEQLIGLFPPGVESVIDWADEPGKMMDAIAGAVKEFGTDLAELLELEVNPLTCTNLLPAWERAQRTQYSEVATFGTVQQRRNQVMARLREKGAPNLPKIRSIIAPLLDYADPSQLVVLESDRGQVRAAHTYSFTGALPFNTLPAVCGWIVLDRAKVSKGGAQVDISITLADLAQLRAQLVAPDTRALTVQRIGRGSGTGSWRLYFPGMFGAVVGGGWTLILDTLDGSTGTLTAASLFVEGVGRDAAGLDGLAAGLGDWGPVAEPSKMGPAASFRAAADAVRRINYATRNGRIIRGSGTPPELCVVPDEPAAIPDECIPC